MATPLLRRQILLLHHRLGLHNYQRLTVTAPHRLWCSAATPTTNPSSSEHAKEKESSDVNSNSSDLLLKAKEPLREDELDYRKWKNKEEEVLRDIEPIVLLTKDIIHSRRYKDGERLSVEDEKAVVEKLLAYHPL